MRGESSPTWWTSRWPLTIGSVAIPLSLLVLAMGCASNELTATAREDPVPEQTSLPRAALGLEKSDSCPEPWAPVHSEITSYPNGTASTSTPPVVDERLDLAGRIPTAPDTDGDGTPDRIGAGVSGEEFVAGRADGELVMARPGGVVGPPSGQSWVGDLDGDGRDELLLYSTAERREDPFRLVIVPGSLPAGRHDPLRVAVLLPLETGSPVVPVGDIDGDGGDDVAVAGRVDGRILSGADLLAAAGSGEVGPLPDPIASAPGRFTEPLWLGGPGPVFPDVAADRSELVLLTDPPVRLGFSGAQPPLRDGSEVLVGAYRSADHRIITLEQPSDRSGISGRWSWDLDDPCGGPRPTG